MLSGPRKFATLQGEKFYSGGKVCPKGHQGLRYTKTGQCVACQRSDSNGNPVDRRSDRHPIKEKICKNCECPMTRRNQRVRLYCSHSCANAAEASGGKIIVKKQCGVCQNEFRGKPAEKYCSSSCKRLAHNKNQSTFTRYFSDLLRQKGRREAGLTLEFLQNKAQDQNYRCAISGLDLTWQRGSGKILTNASIDRIDSNKGYEPDNVQLVCHAVNIMKLDMSQDVFLDWCVLIAKTNRRLESNSL